MSKSISIDAVRRDFPLLANADITYLDNSATSQKPTPVLEKIREYYENYNANPFRGLYTISEKATEEYEAARAAVAEFIHAERPEEVIFTRNATESLNLAAFCLGEKFIEAGDEIIVSVAEHHSNMLPWRLMAQRKGASVRYLDVEPDGQILPEKLAAMLNPKVKIVAVTHMSNVFGRIIDLKTFAKLCHENGAILVADGAQSVPHVAVDVQDLGVDFLAFSGHKMLAPMGIGALYGRYEILKKLPPYMSGGEMIEIVTKDRIKYAEIPHKFEAGTVNAGDAIAFGEAVRYLQSLGFEWMEARELSLTRRALEGMNKIDGVTVIGAKEAENHHGILTFKIDGVHPHDVAAIFDEEKIAVRAGHHCAQPLHQYLGAMSTTRASLMFYNTEEDVDRFLSVLAGIRRRMGYGG